MTNVSFPSTSYLSTPRQTPQRSPGFADCWRERGDGRKSRTCRDLSLLESGRALPWAPRELRQQRCFSQPLCRPPPLPLAPSAGPLAPALAFPGADWPVGVTCKGGGRGCAAEAAPPLGAGLRGCTKNSPSRQSPGARISENAKAPLPERGASPAAVPEVDSVRSFAQGQLYSGAPFSYLLPPPHPPPAPPGGPGLATALDSRDKGRG